MRNMQVSIKVMGIFHLETTVGKDIETKKTTTKKNKLLVTIIA